MKADLNSLLNAFSGTLGNVTFRRMSDGSIVIAKKQKTYPVTAHQRKSGERMKAQGYYRQ